MKSLAPTVLKEVTALPVLIVIELPMPLCAVKQLLSAISRVAIAQKASSAFTRELKRSESVLTAGPATTAKVWLVLTPRNLARLESCAPPLQNLKRQQMPL